ncbi:hypothetical protein J2X04_001696 [Lysobacter niabensis]|uniref:Uncharacterized protein n=1 Tax=Agrilutibacter niabensis TaxID=380628 RepID=A0ABU1VPG2_9GAMM|nr:hypothetical protein [Lysobacter niabensis]MDR7099349.1 hypothetical protein [Lysobacter niabensis]
MKMAVITEGGKIIGATQILAADDLRGQMHASLRPGPGQNFLEVEIPGEIIPGKESSEEDIARFARWLNAWKPADKA